MNWTAWIIFRLYFLSWMNLVNPEVCFKPIWSFDPHCCPAMFPGTSQTTKNKDIIFFIHQHCNAGRYIWGRCRCLLSARVYSVCRWPELRSSESEPDCQGEADARPGLVGIVLTSVICVCLSGTRQHHGRETDTLQSDWAEAYSSLSQEGGGGGGGRSAAVL